MLGDYHAEYASPWAGANFWPCVEPPMHVSILFLIHDEQDGSSWKRAGCIREGCMASIIQASQRTPRIRDRISKYAGGSVLCLEKTVLSLTRTYPESYIHTRTEDVGKAGSLFASNDGNLPWWSSLFPDVCVNIHQLIPYHAMGFPLM